MDLVFRLQQLCLFLERIAQLKLFAIGYEPNRYPVSRTEPQDFMIQFLGHRHVDQEPHELFASVLIADVLAYLDFFPFVYPLALASLVLQGHDDDIGVVVSPQDMLVRVYEIVRQREADILHVLYGIDLLPEQIIYAMHATLQGKTALLLEVFGSRLLIVGYLLLLAHVIGSNDYTIIDIKVQEPY